MRYRNRKPKSKDMIEVDKKVRKFLQDNFDLIELKLDKSTSTSIKYTFRYLEHDYIYDVSAKIEEIFDELQLLVHKFGWFVTGKGINPEPEGISPSEYGPNPVVVAFGIESYYGIERGYPPRYVYHVSRKVHASNVLSHGLVPSYRKGISAFKAGSSDPRVYVATNLAEIYDMFGVGFDNLNNYAVFKIDTTKLRKGVKFYRDYRVEEMEAFWTRSHIPPEALRLLEEEEVLDLLM